MIPCMLSVVRDKANLLVWGDEEILWVNQDDTRVGYWCKVLLKLFKSMPLSVGHLTGCKLYSK